MNAQSPLKHVVRFIIYLDGDVFVARGLDQYIAADGQTQEEATRRLRGAYRAALDESRARTGTASLDAVPPAPASVQARWDDAGLIQRGILYDKYGDNDDSRAMVSELLSA